MTEIGIIFIIISLVAGIGIISIFLPINMLDPYIYLLPYTEEIQAVYGLIG